MVEVLQYFGCGDWQLCSLACQVLWNYCASASDVHSALGSQECTRLVAVLDALLGEFTPLSGILLFFLGLSDSTLCLWK